MGWPPQAGELLPRATEATGVRYKLATHWTAELTATNLTDKRYETAIGYEGAKRGVMLSLRFDAF